MNVRQLVACTTLVILSACLPGYLSAQSFLWRLQEGSVNASAAVSGPTGGDSDGDGAGISNPISANIFAGAGASLPFGLSASGTSRLETTLAPRSLLVSNELDGNGSVGNPEEQSAGGSGYSNLLLKFTVDAPARLTMTGSTDGIWSGDASVDAGFWLESTTEYLTDLSGTGGYLEFETLLIPEETYTLTAYGIASAVTSFEQSFSSAQGGYNIRMNIQGVPVPEPGMMSLFALLSCVGLGYLLRSRRTAWHAPRKSKP